MQPFATWVAAAVSEGSSFTRVLNISSFRYVKEEDADSHEYTGIITEHRDSYSFHIIPHGETITRIIRAFSNTHHTLSCRYQGNAL